MFIITKIDVAECFITANITAASSKIIFQHDKDKFAFNVITLDCKEQNEGDERGFSRARFVETND